MTTPARFVHEDGQGNQTVVPSRFESQRQNDMRSFIDLKAYWNGQIAAGGRAAIIAKQAHEYHARSFGVNVPIDEDIEMTGGQGDASNDSGNDEVSGANNNGKEIKKRGPCGGYRRYTERQINDLLGYVFDYQMNIAKAARLTGITPRTGTSLVKRYRNDEQGHIPTKSFHRKRCPKPILGPEHTEYIIEELEKTSQVYVVELWEALRLKYPCLKVSKSAVHDHIKQECGFTFKRIRDLLAHRNDPEVLEERKAWANEWKSQKVEFAFRSVFVDEASFNIKKTPSYG
ncbi:hypothetical protein BGZ79_005586, partial [Entomortierella chlamydospora]